MTAMMMIQFVMGMGPLLLMLWRRPKGDGFENGALTGIAFANLCVYGARFLDGTF